MRPSSLFLLAAILLASPVGAVAPSPEEAVRSFLRAVYSCDRGAFAAAIVPCEESDRLVSGEPMDPKELEEALAGLAMQAETPPLLGGRPVEGEPPLGSRTTWSVGFRGAALLVPLVLTPEGWKVDPRFWVAAAREPAKDSPEVAARRFLFYLLARNREELARVTPAGVDLEPYLRGEAAFEDQPYELALEMPVAPAREGELLPLPGGPPLAAPAPSGDRRWYLGQYGVVELAFELVQESDGWKVVPRDYLDVVGPAP